MLSIKKEPSFKTKFYRVRDIRQTKIKFKSISKINNPRNTFKNVRRNFETMNYVTTIVKWNKIKIYKESDIGRTVEVKRQMCVLFDRNARWPIAKAKFLWLFDRDGEYRFKRDDIWYYFRRFKKGKVKVC